MNIYRIITALFFVATACSGQDHFSFLVSGSKNNGLQFEVSTAPKNSVIYGMAISVFQNTGRKGSDYSGFIADMAGAYEEVIAREGALYFMAGHSITKKIDWLFRFGFGTQKKYINGKGIPGSPDELWYVRKKFSDDLLCGMSFRYKLKFVAVSVSWDNFHSFGAGVGLNL